MVMEDMSAGRRHYERRVSQARATRKPVTRNAIDEATRLDLTMYGSVDSDNANNTGGLIMWEDMADEDVLVVVQREGSSHRTVEELLNVFLDDVIALALEDDVDGIGSRLDELRDRAGMDSEALDWLANQAESLLFELGYLVEWNDGYLIYREV